MQTSLYLVYITFELVICLKGTKGDKGIGGPMVRYADKQRDVRGRVAETD